MDARLQTYLARIGLDRAPGADATGLALLQQAQRRSIPFENLDILLGREIAIREDAVFDKLVARQRGGYCFEQNRLFADMLALAGFASRPLLARVRLNLPDGYVPPRTHTLLLVDLGKETWIADAGFGGSDVPPLPLIDGAEGRAADGTVQRLRRVGANGSMEREWLVERGHGGEWQPQYTFDLSEVVPEDLEQCSHWTSTRPDTRFTSLAVVSIVLPDGFAAMTDRGLTISRGIESERRTIQDADDYARVLRDLFRLEFAPAEAQALYARARN